jgi:hypothetical protein
MLSLALGFDAMPALGFAVAGLRAPVGTFWRVAAVVMAAVIVAIMGAAAVVIAIVIALAIATAVAAI